MPDTTVKYFDSTMSGAPTLSGTAGALIGLLTACLQDGFGSVTVDTLTVAGDLATATVSGGHQFAMIGTTGPVIRVSGASPAALNADHRITVTSATQFTFPTTGLANQSATGTISAKRAPAGFSKVFSSTNKAAFRAEALASSRLYLRVDDSGTTAARILGYETMTDVDTGSGPSPSAAQLSGGLYAGKSSEASAVARNWALYSDGQAIYFFADAANNAQFMGGFVYGDLFKYASTDAYAVLIIGSSSAYEALSLHRVSSTENSYLCRRYDGVGGSIPSARYTHARATYLGQGGQLYPAPADLRLHLWPIEVWDGTDCARGLLPGTWNPVHAFNSSAGVNYAPQEIDGRTMIPQVTANYRCVIDITGPWR